jgi:hypothetical protein
MHMPSLTMASNQPSSAGDVVRDEKNPDTVHMEVNAASAALEAVTKTIKPSIWSPGMIKLWTIVWLPNTPASS